MFHTRALFCSGMPIAISQALCCKYICLWFRGVLLGSVVFTCPSGGNLVDGSPPAASLLFYFVCELLLGVAFFVVSFVFFDFSNWFSCFYRCLLCCMCCLCSFSFCFPFLLCSSNCYLYVLFCFSWIITYFCIFHDSQQLIQFLQIFHALCEHLTALRVSRRKPGWRFTAGLKSKVARPSNFMLWVVWVIVIPPTQESHFIFEVHSNVFNWISVAYLWPFVCIECAWIRRCLRSLILI